MKSPLDGSFDTNLAFETNLGMPSMYEFNKHGICRECYSATDCTHKQRCALSETRRSSEPVKTPQDWRDYATKTFRFGVILMDKGGMVSATIPRWFKTKTKAKQYGKTFYRYCIAEYNEL